MKEAKHTKGPWSVDSVNSESLHDITLGYPTPKAGNPVLVATVFTDEHLPISDHEAEANAKRIVACVNACEGFSTEHLKPGAVHELILDLDEARRARDALLAACKTILAHECAEVPCQVCAAAARGAIVKARAE